MKINKAALMLDGNSDIGSLADDSTTIYSENVLFDKDRGARTRPSYVITAQGAGLYPGASRTSIYDNQTGNTSEVLYSSEGDSFYNIHTEGHGTMWPMTPHTTAGGFQDGTASFKIRYKAELRSRPAPAVPAIPLPSTSLYQVDLTHWNTWELDNLPHSVYTNGEIISKSSTSVLRNGLWNYESGIFKKLPRYYTYGKHVRAARYELKKAVVVKLHINGRQYTATYICRPAGDPLNDLTAVFTKILKGGAIAKSDPYYGALLLPNIPKASYHSVSNNVHTTKYYGSNVVEIMGVFPGFDVWYSYSARRDSLHSRKHKSHNLGQMYLRKWAPNQVPTVTYEVGNLGELPTVGVPYGRITVKNPRKYMYNANTAAGINTPNWVELPEQGADDEYVNPFIKMRINDAGILQTFGEYGVDDISTWAPETVKPRKVGNKTTNPLPAFMDKELLEGGEWGGRAYVVSTAGITFSQAGDKFNWFRTNVDALLDGDPFHIPVSIPSDLRGNAVTFYENSLLIHTSPMQRLSFRGGIKATSANLAPINVSSICPPVISNDRVYTIAKDYHGFRLQSFSTGIRAEQVKTLDHSSKIVLPDVNSRGYDAKYYLDIDNSGAVLIRDTNNKNYMYRYVYQKHADNAVYSTWSGIAIEGPELYADGSSKPTNGLLFGSGYVLEAISTMSGRDAISDLLALDYMKRITIGEGATPGGAYQDYAMKDTAIAVNISTGETFTAHEPVGTSGEYYVGVPYKTKFELNCLNVRDRYRFKELNDKTKVHKIALYYHQLGGCEITHVERDYDDVVYQVATDAPDPYLITTYNDAEDSSAVLADVVAEVDLHGRADQTHIILNPYNGKGFHITMVEVEGQFAIRSQSNL